MRQCKISLAKILFFFASNDHFSLALGIYNVKNRSTNNYDKFDVLLYSNLI